MLNQVILRKDLFDSSKGLLRLTKGDMEDPEGQVVVEFPLIVSSFRNF